MDNFNLGQGVIISLFSILIVFLILVLLSIIFMIFKYLPFSKETDKKTPVTAATTSGSNLTTDVDQEERMVAMLVASCLAKDEIKGDVRVVSIERTK